TGADGSACRKGAGQIRHTLGVNRVHQGGQTARPGGDHSSALGGAARHPDSGRVRAGLRGKCIFWDRRSAEHTSGDRREAQPGNQRSALRSKDQGAPRRDGRYGACRDACRFQQAHRRRNGEMGQGDPRGQHQGGMKRRFTGISERDVMKLPRRNFLHLAAGAAALPAVSRIARAQAYPSRPVRIVVGFPAGGAPDIIARLIGQVLSERLGQQFVIENRPGAASNIGTEIVVRAPPDGYTLLMVVATNTVNATLYDKLNFNFIRDIAPVASIAGTSYGMLVNQSFAAKTAPEFIAYAYANANPGKINMASAGSGSGPHVAGELFKMMTGVNMVHVPYRGSYWPDLLSGQVQVAFAPMPSSTGYIQAGTLRALAVTGATRSEALPNIPTVGEFVPGYEAIGWYGLGAPKDTPAAIIDKL